MITLRYTQLTLTHTCAVDADANLLLTPAYAHIIEHRISSQFKADMTALQGHRDGY